MPSATETDLTQPPAADRVADMTTKIITRLREAIAANTKELTRLGHVLLGQGHVVVSSHGLTITYDIRDGKAVNPRTCQPATAVRFCEADAKAVARNTHDGTGKPYRAMHVTEALRQDIYRDIDLLEDLCEAVARGVAA